MQVGRAETHASPGNHNAIFQVWILKVLSHRTGLRRFDPLYHFPCENLSGINNRLPKISGPLWFGDSEGLLCAQRFFLRDAYYFRMRRFLSPR